MTSVSDNADRETLAQRDHWEHVEPSRRPPSHPSVRALFEPRADYIATLVPDPSGSSVLDVGCGNGFLTVPLERRFARAVGLDFSAAMIEMNPSRESLVGDASALPFADKSFDLVVESHLLHHLPEPTRLKAVREMGRVARRGVVLYEPNRNNPLMFAFGVVKKHERMSLRFSPSYVRFLLQESGFPRMSAHVEGLTTPNLCPAWWGKLVRPLEQTPLSAFGFYTRAVALAQ